MAEAEDELVQLRARLEAEKQAAAQLEARLVAKSSTVRRRAYRIP